MVTDIKRIGESQKNSTILESVRYVEIKCPHCSSVNDIEPWMLRCFLEINCIYCNQALEISKLRKK